jgi:L-iditol 2-dehydrogenase
MFTPFPPEVPVTIDSQRLYFGDLRIVASYSCGPDDTRAALDLIANGVVTAQKVGADLISLDDVPRAYRDFAQARMIKPIVTFA